MLRFTVNKDNLKEYEEKIKIDEMLYSEDVINIKTSFPHGLRDDDFINFKRVDINNNEMFNKQFFINVVDKNNFTINNFERLTLTVASCQKVEIYSPITNEELKAVTIILEEKSNIITNRNVIINNTSPNSINKRCAGDMVNYNNIFLLKATNVEENEYTEFDGVYYNTLEKINFKNKNTSIDFEVLIPLTYDGLDNQYVLYWFYRKEEMAKANYVVKFFNEGVFSCEDKRFICEKDGVFEFTKDFSGNTDSYIYYIKNVLDIDFNVSKKFNTSLLKNDYYKDFYLENVINNNINDIIDMEKQIFIPKLEISDSNCVVNEIKIKLNIRVRNHGWNSTLLEDYWYSDKFGCTKITDIGFDESDIKYQKSSLKKSFIRLSFYDTPHRGNQKLLYYSTIFLDSNKIFNDYFYRGEKSDLEFTIKNSFDYSACSEGYYLYLFPKLAKKDVPTTIYMKVEFNHAKYGKTITFVLPSDDDYKNGYTNSMTIGTTGIEKLFNDLYIKVNIMYDSKNNKYVWYIPDIKKTKINDNENKRITMTLYEPIVYKTN